MALLHNEFRDFSKFLIFPLFPFLLNSLNSSVEHIVSITSPSCLLKFSEILKKIFFRILKNILSKNVLNFKEFFFNFSQFVPAVWPAILHSSGRRALLYTIRYLYYNIKNTYL